MNGINPNAMNAMVNGTNGVPRALENLEEMKTKLNTCIYDYFLRNEQFDLARALQRSQLSTLTTKTAPPRKLNGEENGDETKDDFDTKKPADLPYPQDVPGGATDNCFLLDWFQIFWEMFFAPRRQMGTMKQSPAAAAYLHQQKEQQTMVRQNGMGGGMIPAYPGMMRPGGPGAINMGARNMPQNPNMRPVNPAAAAAAQQQQMMLRQQQQQQMIQNQQQMAREGSDIDMTDPNMLAQNQFNNFQGQNTKKNLDAYAQNMANQTLRQSMPGTMQGQIIGSQAGMEEFYNASGGGMRGQMPGNGQPQGGQGNHALQDYQMQLMLLEQQNKKRLLMARQEQDQVRPGEQPMGAQAQFAPNMSPQGSRSGPSPNPSEQMKRGTPKIGQAGLPGGSNSPMPDPHMVHARNSPGPMGGFTGMDMMQPGMKGVDGMPIGPGMRPPPSSHPGFNGGPTAAAQMEAMRARQGGQMPNGAGGWQQMAQGQTPGMPQGPQPGQHMGTPQQRNAGMPPPPVQNGANGRPVSPAQSAAAGTPQQVNKANPVNKKGKAGKDTKKQPQKKGTTAATPSADDNSAQTPTPATPITPMHPASFKDGKSVNGTQATTGQVNTNVSAPATQVPQAQQDIINHFEPMDIEPHNSLNMHFGGMDTGDVLEQFDFDAFLDTGEADINFDPMANYGNFDGLEAGAGDA